jgi:hypothetical protein
MRRLILGTLTISGLIVGISAIATASPAVSLLGRDVAVQTTQVEQAAYYYNHHRYKHRSWDKGHRRWRYY